MFVDFINRSDSAQLIR